MGRSGAIGEGFGLITPTITHSGWPSEKLSASPRLAVVAMISPDSSAVREGAAPAKGTGRNSTSAACSSSEIEMWPAEPMPCVPTVTPPGSSFALATRSAMVSMPLSFRTETVAGSSTRPAMKVKASTENCASRSMGIVTMPGVLMMPRV